MNYADIIFNDFTAGNGISVSVFFQGCSRHCPGCHNQETWDFNKGHKFNKKVISTIIDGLQKNGIKRNLAIMGGEPLHPYNRTGVLLLIEAVKKQLPETPIYIWTGYTIEELTQSTDRAIKRILLETDFLIDGPYNQDLRDITLKWRGSSNQRIFDKSEILSYYI